MRDPRYRTERLISRHRDRTVALAVDSWCGRRVVMKRVSVRYALREATCLLRLPPGVAPQLLDLLWHGGERPSLVLEHLEGRTLAEHVRSGVPIDVPRLAYEIGQALAHVHRIGWVHSDIKPENIFIPARDADGAIRLLDFGFAFDRFADSPETDRGGTAHYVAQEVRRGWIADGRADLYSLGMVLRTCFPALEADPAWRVILDSLTSPIPADRYPHAVALRDAIARTFDLRPSQSQFPGFPAGPMRGRSVELQSIIQTVASIGPSIVCVQAQPGTGLTRFLQETMLALVGADLSAARIVDLGNLPNSALVQAAAFLQRSATLPITVLCGVPDPSPSLSWLPERIQDCLKSLRGRPRSYSILLPPLSEESYRELVVTSLGSLDSESEAIVGPLHEQTEGDLLHAALGFDACVHSAGVEDGLSWKLEQRPAFVKTLRAALSNTRHPVPAVPAAMNNSLRRCARAGFAFPTDLGEELLARFGDDISLQRLVDHGYLLQDKPNRLRFVTRRLWLELSSHDEPLALSIDRWLNERALPDLEDIDAVRHAGQVASRVGDQTRDLRLLAAALTSAYTRRSWKDVLKLIGYSTDPTDAEDASADGLEALVTRLEGTLSPDRLRLMVGVSLTTVDPARGVGLLEQVAAGTDPDAASQALIILVDRVADQATAPDFGKYSQALVALVRAGANAPTGIVEFFEARHLMASGDSVGALSYAERAARGLKGSDGFFEALGLQLLGILRFTSSPKEAIAYLRSAIESAQDVELEAQLRHNLALLYGNAGPFHLGEECTDSYLRSKGHRLSPARRIGLRTRRAWAWANLDRIDPAIREARALLSLSSVRLAPNRSIPLRLLLAYCHLLRGAAGTALGDTYSAWRDAINEAHRDIQVQCLRSLIDVVIDLEDWDFISSHVTDFQEKLPSPNPVSRTTEIRASALLAQVDGRPRDALELLREHADEGRRLVERLSAARYLHQMGVAAIQARSRTTDEDLGHVGAELFTEEMSILVTPGHGYYRGRALLELSRATLSVGDIERAFGALTEALVIARRIGSTGLLTDCLEVQARMLIEPK